ncbi:MAG: hypothetical protein FWF75_01425 [Propionibacteriaceae bacterium]|nr:hypothetical protein [Propionibacteriaceae bacterium]
MTTPLTDEQARAALADPQTPARTLQAIAADHPELWVQIAQHPKVYPALLDWLDESGDASVRYAVAARRAATAQPAQPTQPAPTAPATWAAFMRPDAAGATPDQPTIQTLPAQTPAQEEPDERPRPQSAPTRPTWLSAPWQRIVAIVIVALVIVAVVLTFILPRHQTPGVGLASATPTTLAAALADFQTAAKAYDGAQTELQTDIANASGPSSLSPTDVADPATLTALASALGKAQAAIAPAPTPGTTIVGVVTQIRQLEQATGTTTQAAAALRTSITAVQASQAVAALNELATSVMAAQSSYNGAQNQATPPTQQELAALQAQITAAQALIAKNPSDKPGAMNDPAATTAAAQRQQQALEQAVQALGGTASCGGVTIPDGVDAQLVCGGAPASAVPIAPLTASGAGITPTTFVMPSGNIACTGGPDDGVYEVVCQIITHAWASPASLQASCQASFSTLGGDCTTTDIGIVNNMVTTIPTTASSDPWGTLRQAGVTPPTLPYGQAAVFLGSAATNAVCQSSTSAVTCWDTASHHGFAMSSQTLKTW